jgi:2'-5' RNA ligase
MTHEAMDLQMQRLFIGLPIPPDLRLQLASLRPPPGRAIRPTLPGQMHVTMHFVGQAEAQPIATAMAAVHSDPFSLRFDRFGSFGSARRGGILWVGTEPHPQLIALHALLGAQLQGLGHAPESRPFTPHVTLARCRRSCPLQIFRSFSDQPVPELPPLSVNEVVLYSSTQSREGAVYHREFVQPLLSAR